jgi:hypothetical protein
VPFTVTNRQHATIAHYFPYFKRNAKRLQKLNLFVVVKELTVKLFLTPQYTTVLAQHSHQDPTNKYFNSSVLTSLLKNGV